MDTKYKPHLKKKKISSFQCPETVKDNCSLETCNWHRNINENIEPDLIRF